MKNRSPEAMVQTRWSVVVLAAGRGPGDPLASAFGVSHKCLIEIGGTAMLRRVIDTLSAHPAIADISVSIESPEIVDRALGASHEHVRILPSQHSAAASAIYAASAPGRGFPLLITTADHALLDHDMLDHFFAQSQARQADLTVALAHASTILTAHPQAKRTFLHFGDDRVSGCNLFGLMNADAIKAVEFWQRVEQDRKKPWRLVRAFGLRALVAYFSASLNLDSAFALASSRIGVKAAPIAMPFANAAIDVDKPEDKLLAEEILKAQDS